MHQQRSMLLLSKFVTWVLLHIIGLISGTIHIFAVKNKNFDTSLKWWLIEKKQC